MWSREGRLVIGGLAVAALALAAGSASAFQPCCAQKQALKCPVTRKAVKNVKQAPKVRVNNRTVPLCSVNCVAAIKADPAKYVTTKVKDPVTGQVFKASSQTPKVERNGVLYLFFSPNSKAAFEQDPAKYAK